MAITLFSTPVLGKLLAACQTLKRGEPPPNPPPRRPRRGGGTGWGAEVALGLVFLAALTLVSAQAQMPRAIPDETKRGIIRPLQGMAISIDDTPQQLAPGAQIRSRNNLIIVPSALPEEGALADYTVDAREQVFRVWLLTEQEAAREKKPKANK